MLKKIKKNYRFIFIILALIFAVPAVISLIHQGFPLTDDGNWMVIRFSAFYEALRNGQFPVRFLMRLNNGYGYPVADFLYPLFMYIGVPIHILGFNFVDTIKVILITSLITSSLFSYLWLRKLFDGISSLVGSVVYTFFPYHLYDVYKRGSVGEVLSLSVFPFILWQLERRSLIWSSIGIALLILAHNTLALIFLPILVLYGGVDYYLAKNKSTTLSFYLSSIIYGLGISAFFWLPALMDLKYTVFSQTKISDWNNYFSGFNLIGIVTVFIFIAAIYLLLTGKIEIKKHKVALLLFIVGLVSLFFSTNLSSPLWNLLPVSFIQFPFRFLSATIFCVSFLSALTVSVVFGRVKLLLAAIIIVLALYSGSIYWTASSYQYLPDTFYSTNQDTTTVKNEYMPIWVKSIPESMANSRVENLNGTEKINILEITPNKTVFQTYLSRQRIIQVNIIYFPGWTAYVNGKTAHISYDNPNGLIRFQLSKGLNNVTLEFRETGPRMFADLVSIISLIALLALVVIKSKRIKLR